MLGHEHTVGQDGTHDEHAEERGARVKEVTGGPTEQALGGRHPQTDTTGKLPLKPQKGPPQKAMGGTVGSHGDAIHKSRWSPKQAGEGAYQKPTGGVSQAARAAQGLAWCCHRQARAVTLQDQVLSTEQAGLCPLRAFAARGRPFPQQAPNWRAPPPQGSLWDPVWSEGTPQTFTLTPVPSHMGGRRALHPF